MIQRLAAVAAVPSTPEVVVTLESVTFHPFDLELHVRLDVLEGRTTDLRLVFERDRSYGTDLHEAYLSRETDPPTLYLSTVFQPIGHYPVRHPGSYSVPMPGPLVRVKSEGMKFSVKAAYSYFDTNGLDTEALLTGERYRLGLIMGYGRGDFPRVLPPDQALQARSLMPQWQRFVVSKPIEVTVP